MTDAPAAKNGIVLAPSKADLIDAAFLTALFALALIGFRMTFSGWSFLVVGFIGLALGLLIGHLANALRQPLITVALLTVVVFFLVGGAIALRSDSLAGVLPTGRTLTGLASVGVHGWKQLLTTLTPVGSSGPLLAIPYILGLVCGAGGLTMARRVKAAGVPLVAPLAVLAAVILLGTAKPADLVLQGAVFAGVALAWMVQRSQRQRPPVQSGSGRLGRWATSAVLVGAAIAVAAVAGSDLPGAHSTSRVVLRNYVTPPFDISAYPSPLEGFRTYAPNSDPDAHSLNTLPLFSVSGLPSGATIRIATLDGYDGSTWGATSGTTPTAPGSPRDAFQRVGSTIDTTATPTTGTKATVTVTIDPGYASESEAAVWLPTVGTPTAISFSGPHANTESSELRYNLATQAAVVPDRLQSGDSYTMQVVVPKTTTVSADARPFGAPTVTTAASFVHAKATTWSDKAVGIGAEIAAIAKNLKAAGAYSDGLDGCKSTCLPGHSQLRLTGFLTGTQPIGDDEQYAAAFALMANEVGMPTRVVLGATPKGGVVTGNDVHAWVEVHLADGSWAPILTSDFMPDQSKKPQPLPPTAQQQALAAVVPPPNTVRPPSTLDQANQADSTSSHSATSTHHTVKPFTLPAYVVTSLTWGGPPVLIVILLALLVIMIKVQRRRRRRRRGSVDQRVAFGWREVVDYARDLGSDVPLGRTRREEATVLDNHQLAELAAAADANVFGPDTRSEHSARSYWQQVDATRKSMGRSVGRWRRLRASLSLRSLRPRPIPEATP